MSDPRAWEPGKLDPDLGQIRRALDAVGDLIQRISDEVGPGTLRGADAAVERHRSEVYDAMELVGLAAHEFLQATPAPDRIVAAQALVVGKLRDISLTSPIALFGAGGKHPRLSYFELVQHVRAGRAAGADVPTRVLDNYYIHTRIGEAFANRLRLVNQRLLEEVERCEAAAVRPLPVISLQYVGGEELLRLAQDGDRLAAIRVTCIDRAAAAVRHAEQTLRPTFNSRIQILMADPLQWLGGPASPSGTACVVYDVSLLEQLASKRVVRILNGVYRTLRTHGVLLMGSTAGNAPVAERMLRDWLLGWDWQYRSESEWRDLFAQSQFGADCLTFDYEALGINALIRAEKTD